MGLDMNYPSLFSDEFPKEFYDFIYGSVHHHGMENRADYIVNRFGRGKILDVGTGCGHLVKLLRERHAEAYGIEVSDYALSQSCAGKWVQKGDFRNIPFPDNFFDLVTSQAVHGYYPEKDLKKVIHECRRVGKNQFHNIDVNAVVPAYGYQFIKSFRYWQKVFNDGLG